MHCVALGGETACDAAQPVVGNRDGKVSLGVLRLVLPDCADGLIYQRDSVLEAIATREYICIERSTRRTRCKKFLFGVRGQGIDLNPVSIETSDETFLKEIALSDKKVS